MRRFLLIVIIISTQFSLCYAQTNPKKNYSFLNLNMNYIQFYQRGEIDKFVEKWNNTDKDKLVIVHFGDSHVQSDVLTSEYRKILQGKLGNGGRGMLFPYSTADTYSSIDYKSTHTGDWIFAKSFIQPPKLPLGNTGMASATIDSTASFTLSFKNLPDSINTRLRIYCKIHPQSYNLTVFIDSTAIPLIISELKKDSLPYLEIEIPAIKSSISCAINKTDSNQNFFEIYGLELVNPNNSGVVVHGVGVGASRYQSVLHQKLLNVQLPCLNPDLVVLDFGTNDYLYKDIILKSLEGEVCRIIDSVRKWVPDAAILMTSTMDMSRKGRNRKSGVAFSELMHKIAKEKNCLMYDWFWIAGGRKVMTDWVNAEIGQKDKIHLTWKGYRLKGNLLADAFTKTIDSLNLIPNLDSLVFSRDSLIALEKVIVYDPADGFWHDIKSGESLGVIAQKYNVTVSELMEWNDLLNTKIIAGKQLWIYRKKSNNK